MTTFRHELLDTFDVPPHPQRQQALDDMRAAFDGHADEVVGRYSDPIDRTEELAEHVATYSVGVLSTFAQLVEGVLAGETDLDELVNRADGQMPGDESWSCIMPILRGLRLPDGNDPKLRYSVAAASDAIVAIWEETCDLLEHITLTLGERVQSVVDSLHSKVIVDGQSVEGRLTLKTDAQPLH